MSEASVLLFIFGPILALMVIIGFLIRNDPFATEAFNKHKTQIKQDGIFWIYQAREILFWLALPVGIFFLFDTLWGSFLLIISGISIFFFHEKIFRGSYLVALKATKVIGVLHMVLGVSGLIILLAG